MRTRSKLVLIGLATAMLFSLAVTSASARRIEISNQSWLAIWTSLNFTPEGGTVATLCEVTLEGSYHSKTISKVSGQLIGYVTNAAVNGAECTNGSATVLSENLPWHVRYDRFSGTLPTITSIRQQLVGARFRIANPFGIACLSTTTAAAPGFGTINIASGIARTIGAEGSIPCGIIRGTFEGTGEVFLQTPSNGGLISTRINVRLVQ